MPTTRIRTRDLLSGSVGSGSLGASSLTGQVESAIADDADLLLIYDNSESGLRKQTRASFTAGIRSTLSGAYDAGVVITASKGPVDIQRTNNSDAVTTLLQLAVSGTVSGGGNAGPGIVFKIPVGGGAEIGAAIRANKFASDSNNSTGELRFFTTGNDETLDLMAKIDLGGLAVIGPSANEVYTSSGRCFKVSANGEDNALSVNNTGGNVGIGIDIALSPLHVYRSNTAASPQVAAQQGSSGDAGYFLSIPACSYMMGIDNSDSDKLKIVYGSSSTNATLATNPRLIIDTDGDVAVTKNLVISGTQLKVSNSGKASLFLEADTDNSTEADTAFIKLSQDGTAVEALIGFCPDNGEDPEGNAYAHATSNGLLVGATKNFNLHLGTSDTVHMTISGSASSSNKGNIFLISTKDDTTSDSANMVIDSSTGFLRRSTSDRRQKKDISSISSSLDDLCRLVPRHFYDINDENNEVRIAGFVADEIQDVFPDLVPERGLSDEIYRSVAYDRLGAYIVNAIKEIKQRLESLENGD